MSDYEVKRISHENLIVNPENPRYHTKTKPVDEWSAIVYNVKKFTKYIFTLSNDIAQDGLIGSQLPIVMAVPEDNSTFRVYDGNLRITAIKIITTYRNRLEELQFTANQREKLRNLKYNDSLIYCAVYKDIAIVRREVVKLHTTMGLGPKGWEGTAQDVYSFTSGEKHTKRYLVIDFLRTSKLTPQSAKENLEKPGWIRKFEVIISNPVFASVFGVTYSENHELLLHFEEKIVIARLSQLLHDSIHIPAADMAQKSGARINYMKNVTKTFGITLGNIKPLKNYMYFNILTKRLTKSSYLVNEEELIKNISTSLLPITSTKTTTEDQPSDPNNGNSTEQDQQKPAATKSNMRGRKKQPAPKGMETTQERTTLIPPNLILNIDNIRTNDLFTELKLIDINNYSNTVSLALRSLIEFSVNFFLEKTGQSKWAFNEQLTLIAKIEKTLTKLENMVDDSKKFKTDLGWLYTSLATYNASKTHDINSTRQLNIIVHSHKFSPNPLELKSLYNNYHYYLEYLWADYKHVDKSPAS